MRTTIVMTAVLALGVAACGSDTSDEAADETTVEAPMPYAKNLEAAALPDVDKIVAAVKEVCYL